MTLAVLLVVGGAGAAVAGWGGSRGGTAARIGAIAGVAALLVVLVVALAMDAPRVGDGGDGGVALRAGTGLFADGLVPTDYLRLVVALWALDSMLVIAIAWLLGGLAGLRGLLAATLAAITAGIVAFGATDLALGVAAATATGLVPLVVVLAGDRVASIPAAARELRMTLIAGILVLGALAAAPVAAGLALGAGAAVIDGAGASLAPAVDAAGAVVGLTSLAIVLGVGMRGGVIPFHVRVPRLVDVAPPIAAPLLLAWIPVPIAVVGLAAIDRLIAPLALPLDGEHALVVALALFTLIGAALAAFVQDDLRHSVGYLVIADGGLVLLGFAALDPAAWGPARAWLVALAASKTALGAWAAVAEARFETRSLPDFRGWIRRAPILAAALVLVAVATYGVSGWVAFEARVSLSRLAAGPPWDAVLLAAGFLTLPAYLRILAIGTGSASTPVARATPERILRARRPSETLAIGHEGTGEDTQGRRSGSEAGEHGVSRRTRPSRSTMTLASARAWLAEALRRDRAELLSAAVLALAVLAALTSWGALDIGGAASEPAPIVAGQASD